MREIQFSKEDIKRHLIFWVLIVLYLCVFDPYPGSLFAQVILMSITIINYLFAYYIVSLYIFPRYWKNNTFLLLTYLILALIVYCAISYVNLYHLLTALKASSKITSRPVHLFLIDSFLLYSIVAYCGVSFYFNKLRINKLKMQFEKEKALLLKELVYFRNQFGSHVTFNFLNYCYSHVHKNSKETAKAIELYSDMLRYSSDNLSQSQVPLEKEIEYLKNYINLRKLLNKNIFVKFKTNGSLNGKLIYPRLLLTFIENAFKHGVHNAPEYPIKIDIDGKPDQLSFTVINKIQHSKNIVSSGVGLKNARQLLQLHYQDKHNLELAETNGQYRCNLYLNLS